MPGAPFIYYGDEIGMRYVEGLASVEGGYERTGARSPMQWDNGVNAGFSAAPTDKIYIRQDPASDRPTVAGQLDDGESLLNHVRRLIELRQAHSALQSREQDHLRQRRRAEAAAGLQARKRRGNAAGRHQSLPGGSGLPA